MANDRPPKSPSESDAEKSALARYLAKQKQEKQSQEAREGSAKPKAAFRSAFGAKPAAASTIPSLGTSQKAPSLSGVERPPSAAVSKPQPATLRRWESFATSASSGLSESEQRAQESGAPPVPPVRVRDPDLSQDTRPPLASGVRGGDFGPRAIAFLVDGMIIAATAWFAGKILFAVLGLSYGSLVSVYNDGLSSLVKLVIMYFYYGYFYSTKAASPGKLLFGLEVYDTDGVTKLTYWKSFFRETIGKLISTIPFFMGYVIVSIRPDKRALHDLLFDTRVIKKNETIL